MGSFDIPLFIKFLNFDANKGEITWFEVIESKSMKKLTEFEFEVQTSDESFLWFVSIFEKYTRVEIKTVWSLA